MIITVDGPAGAGKSTVARELAKRLDFSYLDSGAIYRTLTLAVLRKKANPEDEREILSVLDSSHMEFKEEIEGGKRVFKSFLDGEDVSDEIRTPLVSKWVSVVSAHPGVRERLLLYQREWVKNRDVVCDGRDMGTRVFPEAEVKFYLEADPEVRALRRYQEMVERGLDVSLESIQENIVARDRIDSEREASPLAKPKDAIVVDASEMTVEEVVEKLLEKVREALR